MKKLKTSFLHSISSSMIAAIMGTLVLCVFFTLKLQAGRELPQDFDRLDKKIAESQAMISNLVSAPVLPPLKESWREVAAALELSGLELKPDESSAASGAGSSYKGPLNHWNGTVAGDAKLVLAIVKKIQQLYPVYLLDYSAADGELKLNLVVVGI